MSDSLGSFFSTDGNLDSSPATPLSFNRHQSMTQHTMGHVHCPACLGTGLMLTAVDADFSSLPFREASPIWIEIRKQRSLRPATHECTRGYLSALERFFAEIRLDRIHAGHLREYQIARETNRLLIQEPGDLARFREISPWRKRAGASMINHELNTLKQMLQHCRLWAPLAPYYHARSIPSWSPREIPDEDEEKRLFEAVKKNPEVALATWVATITANTSASGCELRGMRLKHLILREPTLDKSGVDRTPSLIVIPREATKNDERPRRIPLNVAAKLAFMHCLDRAYRLGSCREDDYLFPFREKKNKYDPTRPASKWWLRNNWNKLRETAEMPDVRPHDMRHLFITRMLESGQDEQTVQELAGHRDRKMMVYYSHFRMDRKLEAVMAIGAGRKKPPRPVIQFPPPRGSRQPVSRA